MPACLPVWREGGEGVGRVWQRSGNLGGGDLLRRLDWGEGWRWDGDGARGGEARAVEWSGGDWERERVRR